MFSEESKDTKIAGECHWAGRLGQASITVTHDNASRDSYLNMTSARCCFLVNTNLGLPGLPNFVVRLVELLQHFW